MIPVVVRGGVPGVLLSEGVPEKCLPELPDKKSVWGGGHCQVCGADCATKRKFFIFSLVRDF